MKAIGIDIYVDVGFHLFGSARRDKRNRDWYKKNVLLFSGLKNNYN